MYTTTGQLKAAVNEGVIEARTLLEYLTDRHYGRAPEPGVLRKDLTEYCRKHLRSQRLLLALYLVPLLWAVLLLPSMIEAQAWSVALLAPVLLAAVISFAARVTRQRELLRLQKAEVDDGSSEELRHHDAVVIYSGFNAFNAYGVKLEAWSLSIDTTKPSSPDSTPEEFSSAELIDHLANALKAGIPGAIVHDCLFARGTAVQGNARILRSKTAAPAASVDEKYLQGCMGSKDPDLRHYRIAMFRVPGSEAVFSTIFRSTSLGGHQFVECHQYLLPGLGAHIRVLDHLQVFRPFRFYAAGIVPSFFDGILSSIASVFWLFGFAVGRAGKLLFKDPRDKQKLLDPHFDYGHRRSIRTAHSAAEYDSFFQSQDKEMLKKSVDGRMLNSLIAFLKAHKIDVGDLENSKQQIFNSGVIVSGGTLKADSLAVGDRAKSTHNARAGERLREAA